MYIFVFRSLLRLERCEKTFRNNGVIPEAIHQGLIQTRYLTKQKKGEFQATGSLNQTFGCLQSTRSAHKKVFQNQSCNLLLATGNAAVLNKEHCYRKTSGNAINVLKF